MMKTLIFGERFTAFGSSEACSNFVMDKFISWRMGMYPWRLSDLEATIEIHNKELIDLILKRCTLVQLKVIFAAIGAVNTSLKSFKFWRETVMCLIRLIRM